MLCNLTMTQIGHSLRKLLQSRATYPQAGLPLDSCNRLSRANQLGIKLLTFKNTTMQLRQFDNMHEKELQMRK